MPLDRRGAIWQDIYAKCQLEGSMSVTRAKSSVAVSPQAEPPPEGQSSLQLTVDLLGGQSVLHRQVRSDEEAHDLVSRGLPAAAMTRLFAVVLILSTDAVLGAIGVSERSFARRRAAPKALLPIDESERVWRFAEILAQATRVFGSQANAEQWLERPALGLDRRKPIDLLRTHPGARLVAQYLTRVEYGVYT
jgi:putative toxin-antitoxin system antitoxin component (TIGR02293 family)